MNEDEEMNNMLLLLQNVVQKRSGLTFLFMFLSTHNNTADSCNVGMPQQRVFVKNTYWSPCFVLYAFFVGKSWVTSYVGTI